MKLGWKMCPLCSSHWNGDFHNNMSGHLPNCNTLRLIYDRFTAVLCAPSSADALALAEKSAPIDDLFEHVRLVIIQSDYLQRLRIQKFFYIYANSSLDRVRRYDPKGQINYDEHHLYLRFDAAVSSLNTLDNMSRVGVAQIKATRENLYKTDEQTASMRAVYICSGPTVYITLMESILILLCELPKKKIFDINSAHLQLRSSCDQTATSLCRSYLRRAHSSMQHSASLRLLCAKFSIARCVLYSR